MPNGSQLIRRTERLKAELVWRAVGGETVTRKKKPRHEGGAEAATNFKESKI